MTCVISEVKARFMGFNQSVKKNYRCQVFLIHNILSEDFWIINRKTGARLPTGLACFGSMFVMQGQTDSCGSYL